MLLRQRTVGKILRGSFATQTTADGWHEASPFEAIPGPKGLPVIGNVWRFLPLIGPYYKFNFLDIAKKFNEDYGKICVLSGIPFVKPIVLLNDIEAIETFYRNEGAIPRRELGSILMKHYRRLRKDKFKGNYGLLVEEGEDWYKTRKAINPIMLQPRNIKRYTGHINEIASDLVENMRFLTKLNPPGEMPDNFMNELNKFGLETILFVGLDKRFGCTAFDLDPNSEAQKLINVVTSIMKLIFNLEMRFSLWRVYPTKDYKSFVSSMDYLVDTFGRYIDEKCEEAKQLPARPTHELSVMEQLMKIDKDLAFAMSFDMFMAGVDTTARVLGATLYFLAKNKSAQDTLRSELKQHLPNKHSPVTNEILEHQLPYLKAVLKESTRLAPITMGGMRTMTEDTVFCGYKIPKGIHVGTSHLLMSQSDEYFPKAKEFIPERWLRSTTGELSYKNTKPFISVPFGFGARSCIGRRLAELDMHIALAKIIRNFTITWPHPNAKFSLDLTYGISSPLKYHVKSVDN